VYGDRGQNDSGVSGGGGGVLGGPDGVSYFIVFPQHSGHCDAVKRRMSAGRTSIDFWHCSQTILRLRTFVSRIMPIVDQLLLVLSDGIQLWHTIDIGGGWRTMFSLPVLIGRARVSHVLLGLPPDKRHHWPDQFPVARSDRRRHSGGSLASSAIALAEFGHRG
jgi:hypothetical protein